MKALINNSTDPYFNLACEEFFMKNSDDDIFLLWQNAPSVIIGLSQNAFSEVNLKYVIENGIKVARRITGGGAVYHDLGNLNFSYITKDDGSEIDFKRFLTPICDTLNKMGFECEINGRNDLVLDGKKISGNAQCRKYGKILHHGTILVNTDFDALEKSLNVDKEKMQSKGINSVRSRVGNLCGYKNVSVSDVKEHLLNSLVGEAEDLSQYDIDEINKLRNEKFSSWEFIYGKSKLLNDTVKKRFPSGSVEISYTIENGIIKDAEVHGDFFSVSEPESIEKALIGCKMLRKEIIKSLNCNGISVFGISNSDIAEILI